MRAYSPGAFIATPYGAAVALGQAVGEFRNPKPMPRRAKAPQHVAMLVARFGAVKRRRGKAAMRGLKMTGTGNSARV